MIIIIIFRATMTEIQKICMLGSARILRKVFSVWTEWLTWVTDTRTPAKTVIKEIIIISVRFFEGNFESYFWVSVASAPWSLEYFWGIWKKNPFSLRRERTKWVTGISEGWTVSVCLMFSSWGGGGGAVGVKL